MTSIPLLPPAPVSFPDPNSALEAPDGLLAAGGELSVDWLIAAYSRGIFPWFDDDDDYVLWWSPSYRAILEPGRMLIRRSLAKRIRNAGFEVRLDSQFAAVMDACSQPREGHMGTWITPRMKSAYLDLHRAGYAHSVETYLNGELCGGLYGVSLGNMFFGESMFSHVADASKVALFHLQRQLEVWQFGLIDCQIMNPHLASLGVRQIPREQFLDTLSGNDLQHTRAAPWRFE